MVPLGYKALGNGIFQDSDGNKFKVSLYQGGTKVSLSESESRLLDANVTALLKGTGCNDLDLSKTVITHEGVKTSTGQIKASELNSFNERFSAVSSVGRDRIAQIPHIGDEVDDLSGRIVVQDSGTLMDAVRSAFRSIAQFFKRPFFMKIYEFFEKKIAPEKFEARHQSRVNPKIKRTYEVLEKFSASKNGDHVAISENLIIGPEERKLQINRKVGGKAAFKRTGNQALVDLPKSLGMKVTGYVVNEDNIKPGSVVPTSTRYAEDEATGDHLINCYMTVDDQNRGIMRTGVINTQKKAEEFITAAKELHEQMGKSGSIRIVSHQLNSPERENKMINAQHRFLLEQAKDNDDLSIVHLNTPCNRFVNYTKEHGTKPIASSILTGEKESHKQNIEGMAQYLDWIVSDLAEVSGESWSGMANNAQTLLKIDEVKGKLKNLVNCGSEEDVKDLRREIKAELRSIHTTIKDRIETIEEMDNAWKQKFTLYRQLLGMQLELSDVEPIGRAQELLMNSLLDESLGVVQAINCKSGLDRTGFLFALMVATKQVPEKRRFELISRWDALTEELNLLYRSNEYDTKAVQEAMKESDNKVLLDLVFKMRQNTLQHLVNICMPITGISTGLIGMKWGKGMTENLIPLNCIPAKIKVGENVEQLLTYNRNGEPKGLTTMGHRIITQLSPKRGA